MKREMQIKGRLYLSSGRMAEHLGVAPVSLWRWVKLKRPPKEPDRVYPLVKNQEYAYAYDWEHRPG